MVAANLDGYFLNYKENLMILSFIGKLLIITGILSMVLGLFGVLGYLGALSAENLELSRFLVRHSLWISILGFAFREVAQKKATSNQPFVLNESEEDNSNEMSQEEWNRAIQDDIKREEREEKRERAIENFREDNGRDPNFFEKWGM